MFSYVMKNELENNLLIFYFFKIYKNNEEQILQIKKIYNFINYLK